MLVTTAVDNEAAGAGVCASVAVDRSPVNNGEKSCAGAGASEPAAIRAEVVGVSGTCASESEGLSITALAVGT